MSFHYKRRRRQEDQHVDDWLMTYADMITLLLAFFAILLSVSAPKREQFEKARVKVMEQFATRDAVRDATTDVLDGKFPPKPESSKLGDDRKGIDSPFNRMPSIVDLHQGGQFNATDEAKLGELPEKPKDPAEASDQPSDQSSQAQVDKKNDGGDRITTLDMDAAQFFPSGSADLTAEGRGILNDLLQSFNSPQYKDYQITVEGHTDDNPISTPQFPSNWELSATRATAVVRYLIAVGIPGQRLRAAGYADMFPKVPNRDAGGKPIPGNQAQNRRVVIKLEKIDPGQ